MRAGGRTAVAARRARSTIDGVRSTSTRHAGAVGLVFQDPESQLFADTVLDDVAFGPREPRVPSKDAARQAAREALERVGLDPAEFRRALAVLAVGRRGASRRHRRRARHGAALPARRRADRGAGRVGPSRRARAAARRAASARGCGRRLARRRGVPRARRPRASCSTRRRRVLVGHGGCRRRRSGGVRSVRAARSRGARVPAARSARHGQLAGVLARSRCRGARRCSSSGGVSR